MRPLANDRYAGAFLIEQEGTYFYTIEAWADHAATWQHDFILKAQAGERVELELMMGAAFVQQMLPQVHDADDAAAMTEAITLLGSPDRYAEAVQLCMSFRMREWIGRYPLRHHAARYEKELRVYVDRPRAGFSAWYSLFPRSTSREYGKPGNFLTTIEILPRLAAMGFDVLYIPPVHPIGHQFRKGKNNTLNAQPDDPGVPYAIGSELGGHDAINPDLGTLDDLKALIAACREHGMELALDLAIQASPDHPWVQAHPEWFKIRPDGSIQYAENPPKKYQDIYPINFESENWQGLWQEILRIILLWGQWGVRIIRIDNPHTKSFGFWEWIIREVKAVYPDMILLSEAFTRPRVMQQLAKIGFTQSYTYYVWRTNKQELTEYLTELTQSEMQYYFRPNFWPNTHDINPYMLQGGQEPLFLTRYFMAATLSANYGIFGPTYEYMYRDAYPGKEEYLNAEKYEIKWWDWDHENKLTELIKIVNHERRANSALQRTNNLTFLQVHNDSLLAYLKTHHDGNRILCVVNLDPTNTQAAWVQVRLDLIGKHDQEDYYVRDLLTGSRFRWQGEWNYVELNPYILPFHLFRIEDQP